MLQFLKRLNETKPFGVCNKCGFYVNKVNNILVLRQVYIKNYICDFCGPISKDQVTFGAKRKGNLPVKEKLKIKVDQQSVNRTVYGNTKTIDYELNFSKEINEMIDLIILSSIMMDNETEVGLYDGSQFGLLDVYKRYPDLEELLIIIKKEKGIAYLSIVYSKENFEIRLILISDASKGVSEDRIENPEKFEDKVKYFYKLLIEE